MPTEHTIDRKPERKPDRKSDRKPDHKADHKVDLKHKIDLKADHKIDLKIGTKLGSKIGEKIDPRKLGHKLAEKFDSKTERRKKPRYPLGLPVQVHLAGHPQPMTVELIDVSAGGGRFRSATGAVRINQTASFVFVVPGPLRCLAKGRVVRTDGAGEFALRFQGANAAFLGFIGQLAS